MGRIGGIILGKKLMREFRNAGILIVAQNQNENFNC